MVISGNIPNDNEPNFYPIFQSARVCFHTPGSDILFAFRVSAK